MSNRDHRDAAPVVVWLLGSVLLFLHLFVGPALAGPPNIIILFPDDMEWNDFPIYGNLPIQWAHPDDPIPQPPQAGSGAELFDEQPQIEEAGERLPGLNRLAARMFAVDDITGTQAALGPHYADDGFKVVPIDIDNVTAVNPPGPPATANADGFRYAVPAPGTGCARTDNHATWEEECKPAADILRGHGGLARLAREGVVFPRFYTTSSVCAPTRGSLMTGRHVLRTGQQKYDSGLDTNEITIAEFLKQGCRAPVTAEERLCVDWSGGTGGLVDCPCYLPGTDACDDAPCYTTGAIGKWHLGSGYAGNTWPWLQGFDEYIGIHSGIRKPFKTGPLVCGPDTRRYCVDSGSNNDKPCVADADCGPGGTCSPVAGFAWTPDAQRKGLYIGDDRTAKNVCTGSAATTNVDCCEPIGDVKSATGEYTVKEKNPPGFTGDGGDRCNDDGDTSQTGCVYYPRMMRDQAKDFVARHAPQDPNDPPFFLFVSFTAIHRPETAPDRTKLHYPRGSTHSAISKPRALDGRFHKTLPMLEELDAAIGEILSALDDPDGDGNTSDSIADNTLVFFTPDQGQNRKRFGNPNFAGGKSKVEEGGIRTGLLARGTSAGLAQGETISDDRIGSLVDLFPTIADAAGYNSVQLDVIGSDGRLDVNLEACLKDGAVCHSNADCTSNNGPCGRKIDGISLLPVLQNQTAPTWQRDKVYAHYSQGSNKTVVVTRPGLFADGSCVDPPYPGDCATKMCGYESQVWTSTCSGGPDDGKTCQIGAVPSDCAAPGTCPGLCRGGASGGSSCAVDGDCPDGRCVGRLVHVLRGGSDIDCTLDSQCRAISCDILGKAKVCLSAEEEDSCIDNNLATRCVADIAPRCRKGGDCPNDASGGTRRCVAVRGLTIACNKCMTASWKLKGTGRRELYDLTSNPEEEDRSLDLDGVTGADGGIERVQAHLEALVDNWKACSSDKNCSNDYCENNVPPSECPTGQ